MNLQGRWHITVTQLGAWEKAIWTCTAQSSLGTGNAVTGSGVVLRFYEAGGKFGFRNLNTMLLENSSSASEMKGGGCLCLPLLYRGATAERSRKPELQSESLNSLAGICTWPKFSVVVLDSTIVYYYQMYPVYFLSERLQ